MTSYRGARTKDVGLLETTTEIAGRGRVGDTSCVEGVEEDFVLAAEFDVLEAGAVAQRVVGKLRTWSDS